MVLGLPVDQKVMTVFLYLIFIFLLISDSFETSLFIVLKFKFSLQFYIFADSKISLIFNFSTRK